MSTAALLRLFSSSLVVITAATAQGPGTIKILGPGGGVFAAIQDAVDAAAPGAVILVLGGTHAENVVIDKPLTLRGAGGPAISVGAGSAIFVDKPAGPV